MSDANHFDLCNEVFERIVAHYGDEIDASALPDEHRTVLLAWHAMGIIGNGGFNYLFEASFDGDPHFLLTAEAFRAIECREAAEAFQRALDLFPNSKPPADISRRLKIYRRGTGELRHEIDSQFWNASDAIEKCLAAFIRAHEERLVSLGKSGSKPRKREDLDRLQELAGPSVDLGILPHWARIAFAARCARSVLPVFDLNWPDAPEERRQSVVNAIAVAEDSAANGRPNNGLKDTVLRATITAGAALHTLYGFPGDDDEVAPPDGNMATMASLAAKAAEKAAEAAQASPNQSERFALEAFSFAQDAGSDNQAVVDRIWNDLGMLSRVAAKYRWNDQTQVPADVFESLPEHDSGDKPWWKFW